MRKNIGSVAALLAIALLVSCVSEKCDCGGGKAATGSVRLITANAWEASRDGDAVVLEGTIRRVGSDPLSRLVLTDAEGRDWKLDAAAQKLLRDYEQKPLKLAAVLRLQAQILADGKELPPARLLTEVSIVK